MTAQFRSATRRGRTPTWFVLLTLFALSGCASLTNPVRRGLKVEQLAQELQAMSREEDEIIPLSLLGQPPMTTYRVAAGDVLGIYIEGIVGDRNQPPPQPVLDAKEMPGSVPPGVGFPIPVQENGTIQLPQMDPLVVTGRTLGEIQGGLRQAYTVQKKIIQPGRENIIVTLLRPRHYRVVVMREDSAAAVIGGPGLSGQTMLGLTSRGSGHLLNLPAYENDVLHALAQTGGLPGRDAYREIVIHRGQLAGMLGATNFPPMPNNLAAPNSPAAPINLAEQVIRIPLMVPPGCKPNIKPEEVVLNSGDVVYLESRDRDVFFTGGLLPSGQHFLPRDFDLDIVEAVSRVGGPMVNGGVAVSNLSGSILLPGIGNPSPKQMSIVRKVPGGGQVVIVIDLHEALRDPSKRLIVRPGDVLILQETPVQAVARWFTQSLNVVFGYANQNMSITGVGSNPPSPFLFPRN